MLGFNHDTENLLHVEDYTSLKCCPKNQDPDYLWTDINLSKDPAFPKLKFGLGKQHSKDVEYLLFRAHCNGVKVDYIILKIFFNLIYNALYHRFVVVKHTSRAHLQSATGFVKIAACTTKTQYHYQN